ncbi:MAG: DNA-3-methyladenine glycosylase 2 family protein [Gammaproteobacteria bacterium]|nr:DNA-3-methyladenine glycosylase 2 family protein [Gammaproteobacteria bacterium]
MPSKTSEAPTVRELSLPYEPPYDWAALLEFHRARAIPGVEEVAGECYRRIARTGTTPVLITVRPAVGDALVAEIEGAPADAMADLERRLRRAFDLDTDTAPIRAHLAGDARLGPLVAARPGLRVPGSVDGFEQAVRAILGQQVSVAAARDLAARLCQRWGEPVRFARAPALTRTFPRAATLVAAEVAALGMPGARGRAVSALAAAALAQPTLLEPGGTLDAALTRLQAVCGIGPWSANYIALRALRHFDAFPASDVGILRALVDADGRRPAAREADRRAEAWRPWRGYAAQYLWTCGADAA